MRCKFCGWDNPQGKDTCEKCNKPLAGNSAEDANRVTPKPCGDDRATNRQAPGAFDPKATVREKPLGGKKADTAAGVCPQCGYNLENGECAVCGYKARSVQSAECRVRSAESPSVQSAECRVQSAESPSVQSAECRVQSGADVRKTMRPVRKGEKESKFKLVPISEETGQPEGEALSYSGGTVVLNRENTNPRNMTITSGEQARVSFEDGKWCVEDRSEYKTTFVQAARKVELRQGDLLLLGNQLYRFEG